MIISTLEIKNILSIESASVSFDTKGLVLLEGYNYDDDRGNGSGKTAIFNALSFALFDKVPRRITKSEILRRGTRSGYAFCETTVGSNVWGVKRFRPSKVEFYKDGIKIDIEQDEFENQIGLTYNQFLITMYTAQGAYDKRFISLNDSAKKNFILELMNLDKFNGYYKECKDRVKEIDTKNSMLNTQLDGLKSNVNIYKQSIEDESIINNRLRENEALIDEWKLSIKEASKVNKPDTIKYDQIKDTVSQKKREIYELKINHSRLTSDLITLERSKKSVVDVNPDYECPNCKEPLFHARGAVKSSLVKSTDIQELKKLSVEYNNHVDEQVKELSGQIAALKASINKEKALDDLLIKINKKQGDESQDFNNSFMALMKAKSEISICENNINTLKSKLELNEDKKNKMAKVLNVAKDVVAKIKANNANKILIESVMVIFAPTGAPAHIMEEFVDNFNDVMQDNIAAIWTNASYCLQTYKVSKDKTVNAKFSESLMIDSKEVSIGSLSGGEFRSLSLAADFTIIDVLQQQFNINLCPIILDEPFDGLDSIGRETVVNLLDKMSINRQVWVIDHASEAKTMFSKSVKVEKRNGISTVSGLS